MALWLAARESVFGVVGFGLILAFLPQLPALVWASVSQGLFQAASKVRVYYYCTFLGSAANLVGVIVLVGVAKKGVPGLILSNVISALVVAFLALLLLLRISEWKPKLDRALAMEMGRASPSIHVAAIGYLLFASSDMLIINRFSGPEEVSWYRIAAFLFGAFVFVPHAMSSSLFSLGARLGVHAAWQHQRRIVVQTTALMTIVAVLCYPLWPRIVFLLAGPGFEASASLVRILMLGLWGMILSALMASQWILRGLFWPASLSTIGNGLLNLLLNFWAVPRWGAEGAAWTKVACFGLTAALNIWAGLYVFNRARPALVDDHLKPTDSRPE